jgi:ABC-2 type transport system ATP-binding protein
MIRSMKSDGTAVLISSHLLDRVQAVCDRVALFNRGRIALEGTVPELAQRVLGGGYVYEVEAEGLDVERTLAALPGAQQVTKEGRLCRVLAERDIRADIARAIVAGGGNLLRLADSAPSLDTVYRHYFEGQPHGTA